MQKAQTASPIINYKLLLSNECFEIWYILHFQDITERLYRGTKPQKDIVGLIKPDGSNSINIILRTFTEVGIHSQKAYNGFFEIMQEKGNESAAIQRAKNLAKSKSPTDKFALNPSTDIYILIEMLNNLR